MPWHESWRNFWRSASNSDRPKLGNAGNARQTETLTPRASRVHSEKYRDIHGSRLASSPGHQRCSNAKAFKGFGVMKAGLGSPSSFLESVRVPVFDHFASAPGRRLEGQPVREQIGRAWG